LEKPIERKYFETTVVQSTGMIAGTPQLFVLNNVSPVNYDGTIASNLKSQNCRVGQGISMTKLRIRGQVYLPRSQSIDTQATRVRMLVVRFPENNQGLSIANVPWTNMISPAKYGATYNDDSLVDGFKNPYPACPYDILYDRTFYLQTVNQLTLLSATPTTSTQFATSTEKARIPISIDLKLKQDANWSNPTSASTPTKNGIAIYMTCNVDGPHFLLNNRLNFLDN